MHPQSWVLGYVKLARKRGFTVKELRDGYRFLAKDGVRSVTCHMSPGGRNRQNMLAELVKIGVISAEERSR